MAPAPTSAPNVVGQGLPEARTTIEAAGLYVDPRDAQDRDLSDESEWVVVDQSLSSRIVRLDVIKTTDPTPAPPASSPAQAPTTPAAPAESAETLYARTAETKMREVFGVVDSFAETCDPTDSGNWSCYVSAVEAPLVGNIVVTLDLPSSDTTLGDTAARAVMSLVGEQMLDLNQVQVMTTSGQYIGNVMRSDIPFLNQ